MTETKDSGVTAILLASCPDQKGLVAKLSRFIYENDGNITDSDQHTDHEAHVFFIRLEWEVEGFRIPKAALHEAIARVVEPLAMKWTLQFSDYRPRMAVWVSRQEHCLLDLLGRQLSGEINADIALVVSNHESLRPIATQFGVPFHYFPITPETKASLEQEELRLLEQERIDLVVLAKYMQVLSPAFLQSFPQVINIHHSFLPAFPGAQPYHRAFARGVKIIGATAHYVTRDLDEGPIIEQDVCRVSHRDSVQDMVRKGKDLEKVVLSRAIYQHLEQRVLVYGKKTVVFE